ncbi:hypothetical protein DPMN_011074 [Dreissena polymorpha]|uniref:Uncharacterized protein n=1 Tax=Dreissena polymorpha TaxID=45954 RepID=A0A9D4N2X1_DREPO|nr:hypothetical protein DPMN_011074 [Dreissena polymorpha]
MWILTRDKRLATSTSLCPSCFLPLVNGGIAKEAPRTANSSAIKNPLSASTPYSSFS